MRKAIFWDFEGTLTMAWHMWTGSVLKAAGPGAERYGITFEKLRPYLHSGFPWDEDGTHGLKGGAWWEDMFTRFSAAYQSFGMPEAEADAAARRVRELILSPKSYRVRKDAAAVLAVCCYKGYKNYLLSNNYPELDQVLEQLYLRPFFSGLVISGQVGMDKPELEIFRLAERKANFPSEIWMVGDNPIADIEGGKRAGWKTALVRPEGRGGGRELSQADITAGSLTELMRLL